MGGGSTEPPPPVLHAPIAPSTSPLPPSPLLSHPSVIPAPPLAIPAPLPSFLRRQEPPLPPNPATLTSEQECRTMPLSPQHRRHAPHAAAGNHALANADQNLTKVDARLTKVDKGCQNLTPSTPAPTPNPSKTQQNRNRAHYPDTPVVNLRCQPLQHTPNKPEQIRTNLNKPEHRQAPRPDRDTHLNHPRSPRKTET